VEKTMNTKIPKLGDSDLGQWIWQNLVPKSGQSDTVRGELLRANEKLRDESLRNGNANWDKGFEILIDFLEETLCRKRFPFFNQCKSLRKDLDRLRNHDEPYLEDDLFDRIESHIFSFCRRNRKLIPHEKNKELNR